jgi:hypothetical protein
MIGNSDGVDSDFKTAVLRFSDDTFERLAQNPAPGSADPQTQRLASELTAYFAWKQEPIWRRASLFLFSTRKSRDSFSRNSTAAVAVDSISCSIIRIEFPWRTSISTAARKDSFSNIAPTI